MRMVLALAHGSAAGAALAKEENLKETVPPLFGFGMRAATLALRPEVWPRVDAFTVPDAAGGTTEHRVLQNKVVAVWERLPIALRKALDWDQASGAVPELDHTHGRRWTTYTVHVDPLVEAALAPYEAQRRVW